MQPLFFRPCYKEYLWGGERLRNLCGRQDAPVPCAESWEIAAHPDGDTVVAQGSLAGRTLSELVATYGAAILGSSSLSGTPFPLLFKVIDARDNLSVQVHPSTANAHLSGGDPKSELWWLLDAAPDARIYAGLKPGTTEELLTAAVAQGALDELLVSHAVSAGHSIYIAGGTLHAIGRGCLIYEIQQNSNTTYRLFDWNRRDARGATRELHVSQGLQSIDWRLSPPPLRDAASSRTSEPAALPADWKTAALWRSVASTPYFNVQHLSLHQSITLQLDGSSFQVLFALHPCRINVGDASFYLEPYSSCLIPAALKCYTISPNQTAGSLNQAAGLLVTTLVPFR